MIMYSYILPIGANNWDVEMTNRRNLQEEVRIYVEMFFTFPLYTFNLKSLCNLGQGRKGRSTNCNRGFSQIFLFLPFPLFWAEMLQILNCSPIFISPYVLGHHVLSRYSCHLSTEPSEPVGGRGQGLLKLNSCR